MIDTAATLKTGSLRAEPAADEGRSEDRALADITTLASMRLRMAQAARTAPVVLMSTAALLYALTDRVAAVPLYAWAASMVVAILLRTMLCRLLRPRLDSATPDELERFERYLFASAILNALVMGAAFWLVARNGDITVKLVITLMSCFFGIGTLVNASSHFSSFLVVSCLNMGQGVMFWLGIGSGNVPSFEVAIPFLAVTLLVIGFGRENSRQFRDSLRIRTENVMLLERLAREKVLVEQALEQARIASESKSRFLAAASHDLRQPLHAMTMFLGTLSFHVSGDDAVRLLRRIKDTTVVLQDQFNSLLDLSRFDVGAVQAEIGLFRLDRSIELIIAEFQPQAAAKKLTLSAAVPAVTARSDGMLVERVIRNLVGNAVKYTAAGSVVVTVEAAGAELVVDVIDTGPGIPEDQQARIFEEYVQLANPARQRRHGVGLGLAIVKRIDLLLNLRLVLKSATGLGSRFRFYLPAADEISPAPAYVADPTDAPDTALIRVAQTIWILDDDPDGLEAFFQQLSAWGASVKSFSTPTALLEELRSGALLPHWILTDDMLGAALSGLETAQILSREFGFGRVCLITGNTEPRRLTQLRASGFPVIIKPAQPEVLAAILREGVRVTTPGNPG